MSTQITAGAWRRDKRFSPTLGGRWDFDRARLQTCIMGKDKYQSYYKELESFYFKHETREKKSFHEYNVCTMFMLEKQQDDVHTLSVQIPVFTNQYSEINSI